MSITLKNFFFICISLYSKSKFFSSHFLNIFSYKNIFLFFEFLYNSSNSFIASLLFKLYAILNRYFIHFTFLIIYINISFGKLVIFYYQQTIKILLYFFSYQFYTIFISLQYYFLKNLDVFHSSSICTSLTLSFRDTTFQVLATIHNCYIYLISMVFLLSSTTLSVFYLIYILLLLRIFLSIFLLNSLSLVVVLLYLHLFLITLFFLIFFHLFPSIFTTIPIIIPCLFYLCF